MPEWANSDRFEVKAKAPEGTLSSQFTPAAPKAPPTAEERQMLRSLLMDRFQLRFHPDTREGPIYLLVRGKRNLNMFSATDTAAYAWSGGLGGGMIVGDGLQGINESMADLAWRLSRYLERPILDQTGLSGSFDFRMPYTADDQHADVVSMILTTVQDLGLKLEPSRGPVETIVIEHAEKPSSN